MTLQVCHTGSPPSLLRCRCCGSVVCGEVRLGGETVAEALKRAEQGVDLEQRVLAELCGRERELERDRVHAVGDLENERRLVSVPPLRCKLRRVLDVHANERVAVQADAI